MNFKKTNYFLENWSHQDGYIDLIKLNQVDTQLNNSSFFILQIGLDSIYTNRYTKKEIFNN